MTATSDIFPLKLSDNQTGHYYLLWPWQDGLRVEMDALYYRYETTFERTLFGTDGHFLPALKAVLPIVFLDWAETIPLAFRRAVGTLAGQNERMPQLLILRLMQQDVVFRDWVQQLAASEDGVYFRLVWELADIQSSPVPVQETWLLSLPGQKRHLLLGRLLSMELTASQAKKCRKLLLDNQAWGKATLKEFFKMTRQSDFQTLLQTADYIRLGAFDYLRTLPRWLWIGKLWEALSAFNDHAIERVLPPLILKAELKHRPQIARSFRQMSENGDLEARVMKLSDKLAELLDFPLPPFAGNEQFIPIDSAKKLKAEGQQMRHCVAGFMSEVVEGESYFYHWTGDDHLPTRLTLQLKPFPKSTQWRLFEALGFENEEIDDEEWRYLEHRIADLNPPWGYLLVKTPIAGLPYGDYEKQFAQLKREMPLKVYHEAQNPHDDKALRIDTFKGDKLGYVPRECQSDLWDYVENGEPLRCRLNFLKPDYATVNIYLAPNTENGAGRLKRLFSKFRHDLKPREKND